MLSLFATELKQHLITEVAKNGQLGREVEVTKKQVSDMDTRREHLKLGLGIIFRDL